MDAMNRLATYMKQQNSRETQVRGMRELEAINGEKGNSIKTVLEVSTVIMRKKRKFFCTGEVKEPIVNNKIICKVRYKYFFYSLPQIRNTVQVRVRFAHRGFIAIKVVKG